MVHRLQDISKCFLKKTVLSIQLTTFNWYANILNSKVWQYYQKLKYIISGCFWYLKQFIHRFHQKHYEFEEYKKTKNLSIESNIHINSIQIRSPEKNMHVLPHMDDPVMTHLPIIFLHFTYNDYLKLSLCQAKHSNPKSMIYLIGNDTNNCYDFIEHHSFLDYFQGARDLSKIYIHLSSNSYKYELFCLQRWFILKEFLVTNNINECLYLDSDTMLYTDVTDDRKKFAQYDFTLSYVTSGCTFFLNRVGALADFCRFITDIYTKKEQYYYDRMLAHYAALRKNRKNGGVSDMSFFDIYRFEHFGEIGEVAQIIDGSLYDPSICVSQPGFEMENGIKKIIWKNHQPYGKHIKTGKEIKFNSLQFQGDTKNLMSQFYTGGGKEVKT